MRKLGDHLISYLITLFKVKIYKNKPVDYVFPEVVTREPLSEPPAKPELISFTYGLLSGKIQRNRDGRAVHRKKNKDFWVHISSILAISLL